MKAAARRRALREATDRPGGTARVTDTGFAIGELILAAADAVPILGAREGSKKVAERLIAALEGVGIDRARLSKPPIEALNKAVPLVLYFRTEQDADEFSKLVHSVMIDPRTIELPEKG